MNTIQKATLLQKRKWRIRKKVVGTIERPRLSVKFSSKHIYAQAINDETGVTLAYVSSLSAESRKQPIKANLAGAKLLGQAFVEKAKAAGIKMLVFDRNGRPYHGKVKVFADTVREAGLQF